MSMEKHPLHLKNPELQTSPEVQRAVVREERQTGERIPNDPAERIEAYMGRLENIFLNPDERVRERNLEMFREKIYDALIIKKENFPESYFELQKRVAREQGHGDIQISEEMREQMMDVAIEDQKHSLDAWMDYLTSNDAVYPAWFKYFVWRNITKLSQFDKERGEFKKRTDSTVAPYPDIYREPLAQIADVYEKVKEDNKNLKEPEIREAFSKKFPNLYAELISKSLAASIENREEVRGQWVKYEQGDNAEAERLFQSLEGKGTGWCTAGRSTAETQIESGDFYVYYTNDSQGNPTQPRLAIRMEGKDRIGEVRGILPHQNVEPVMEGVLDSKLKEFGSEADAYHKKSEDMRLLTSLEHKREKGDPFTKDDLVFLYEINSTIEGFGYKRDPRIEELRKGRNTEEDILTIFECTKDQIAHVPSEIHENTKVYVGQLEPGIFQKLPENLEHVYTSFPGKKIRRENIEIGGKSAEQLISEMEEAGIDISDYAKSMLRSREFTPGKNQEEATIIRLTVADLGFRTSATTDQIYERAQALGLELCPPDTGPNYRLKYRNQPLGEWFCIGMKQITDSGGYPDGFPHVFWLGRGGDGLWLNDLWVQPSRDWGPSFEFAFRLRKSES
ncbi:MAG: hypothetical protein KGL39_21165 [Patescibacteria group bacterium]|nr:hypothetical protein [Patescibacteria group bacterium]